MEMGNALAGDLADVGENIYALCPKHPDHGLPDSLGDVIDFVHRFHGGGKVILIMGFRKHEGMSFGGLRDV